VSRVGQLLSRVTLVVAGLLASGASLYTGGEDPPAAIELYAPCHVTAECVRAADACLPTGQNTSVCSATCAIDADCPGDGVCVERADDEPMCFAPCESGCPECCAEGLICRVNMPPAPACRP